MTRELHSLPRTKVFVDFLLLFDDFVFDLGAGELHIYTAFFPHQRTGLILIHQFFYRKFKT